MSFDGFLWIEISANGKAGATKGFKLFINIQPLLLQIQY